MLSFFPRGDLDEICNLIESVSEDFPSYSLLFFAFYISLLKTPIPMHGIHVFFNNVRLIFCVSYPAGTWRRINVVMMSRRRHNVSISVRRHLDIVCSVKGVSSAKSKCLLLYSLSHVYLSWQQRLYPRILIAAYR